LTELSDFGANLFSNAEAFVDTITSEKDKVKFDAFIKHMYRVFHEK